MLRESATSGTDSTEDQQESLLTFHAEDPQSPGSDLIELSHRLWTGRRRLVVAGAAIGVALALVVLWTQTRDSAAQTQYETSALVLTSTLDAMASAQSSQDVRAVAAAADDQLAAISATLESDRGAPGAAELSTMRDTFAYLAALQDYTDSDTSTWTGNREALLGGLRTLAAHGGTTAEAGVEGEDMALALDELSRRLEAAPASARQVPAAEVVPPR